jgi:phospholipid/cholesterol/gamma-HCH transport system ATP-binding protein
MMSENIIVIKSLYKSFGDQDVLQGVSLELRKGENLVIMGKSGTGKSVLIKCIVGLIVPEQGSIQLLDHEMTKVNYDQLNELRKRIGFLFQSAALYDSMSVRDNLEFPLRKIKGHLKTDEITTKVMTVLQNVGLEDAVDKMPSQLSGGMRKRIGLARTLILNPEIMLYDEPTTGLDPITSSEISELINSVQKNYHTSSIIITHDVMCARHTANRIVLLNEGKVYAEGTFDELAASKDKWISSFFL